MVAIKPDAALALDSKTFKPIGRDGGVGFCFLYQPIRKYPSSHGLQSSHQRGIICLIKRHLRRGAVHDFLGRMYCRLRAIHRYAIMCTKRREVFTNDYPPVVTDKLRSLNLAAKKPPAKKSDIIRKAAAVIIYAVLFALVLRFINGITTFLSAAVTAYLLWLVVDWYDFLVVDILMAPFDKFYKMARVSPIEKSAVWFHCKASLRGMLIGVVFAPVVGLIVILL